MEYTHDKPGMTITPTKWADVNNLTVNTSMGDTATIFANGLQMTPVYVKFTLTDVNVQPITVTDSLQALALRNTTLIDYTTGKPLTRLDYIDPDHRVPGDGWYFCTSENGFVTANASHSGKAATQPTSGDVYLTFYVACKNSLPDMKKIGVSIQPEDPNPLIVDGLNGNYGKKVFVAITAKVANTYVDVMTSSQTHSEQGTDNGGPDDYKFEHSYKNLWRQNNFILRLKNSDDLYVNIHSVTMRNNKGQVVVPNSDGYHIYSDSTKYGFNTQCYIFKPGAKNNTPVTLLGDIQTSMTGVSWENEICIAWLTQYFPMNKWETDETSPVSIEAIGVDGNSYFFTPNSPHNVTYSDILSIVKNVSGKPELLVSMGRKTAEEETSITRKNSRLYIINVEKNAYLNAAEQDNCFYLNAKDSQRGQWVFSYASTAGLYNVLLNGEWNTALRTQSSNKQDKNGSMNIYKKGDGALFVMLNPIWNPPTYNAYNNQLQILCTVNGISGWLRVYNDEKKTPQLFFTDRFDDDMIFSLEAC